MKQFVIKNKNKFIKMGVVLILLLAVFLYFYLTLVSRRVAYVPRAPYDKTGFVDVKEYKDSEIVLSKNNFVFTLNVSDTTFNVLDQNTNQVYNSIATKASANIPEATKEMFIVYYETKLETPRPYEVNKYSVDEKKYAFRLNEDGSLEVLYMIGGKLRNLYEDLPKRIEKTRFETLILEPLQQKLEDKVITSSQFNSFKSQFLTQKDDNEEYYFLKSIQSQNAIDLVYRLIFEESNYTFEDYINDNTKYGFPTIKELPYFEFSVRYALTNKGLEVTLINDSIVELESYPIAYIDILPYFGSNNIEDEGFTLIPDGSGVVIHHDNNKYNTIEYDKRVYGTDISIGNQNQILAQQQEKINLPMYGYSKNENSFINVIEQGASMTNIKAGFRTTGSYTNKIPYIYYRYSIRERDAHEFSTNNTSQNVYVWTKNYNTEDFKSSYIFLDTNDYYGMAKAYQEYLIEKYELKRIESQDTLHLTLLGGYQERKYFLGIPHTKVKTLTNPSQALAIVEEVMALGINNIDLHYQGWSNNGLKPIDTTSVDLNKNIASKKALTNLKNALDDKNIQLFLDYSVQTTYSDKGISTKDDVAQTIMQKPVYMNSFDQATQLVDVNSIYGRSYKLNYSSTTKAFESYIKTVNGLGLNTASFMDLTSEINSNFKVNNLVFRNDALNNQISLINSIDKEVALRNPNLEGMMHANKILDLPVSGTNHRMVDYDIPFVQLVLNGYFEYASQSVNMTQGTSTTWHLLNAIETGSQIQFTLSYLSTIELVQTEYNEYFSTHYKNWLDDIKAVYSALQDLGIYNAVIVNHQVKNNTASIVEVTYSNGKKITIDYNSNTYQVSEVIL